MGVTGPIPKRSDHLVRRNLKEDPIDKVSLIGVVEVPGLDIGQAHPLVQDLYKSLAESGQSRWYEASDWSYARLVMFALNQELTATYKNGDVRPISAVKLQVINQMMASLMMTEGERRRARLEIERDQSGSSGEVVQISDLFKQRLGAT